MAGESAREMARRQREKAEALARSAERWERGAEGESATAEALALLPPDWTVLHDLPWPGRPRANIDHLVVGPSGVFVIDSKNWSGTVTLRDGELRQNGRSRARIVAAASQAADAVSAATPSSRPDAVHAVLCLVGDEVPTGNAGKVRVCSTGTLVSVLTGMPVVLDVEAKARICQEVRSVGWGRSAPAQAPLSVARTSGNSRSSGGSSRRVLSLVLGLGLVAAAALLAPRLGPAIAHIITPSVPQDSSTTAGDPSTTPADIAGTWRGDYACGKSARGTLDIKPVKGSDTKVRATFRFGPSNQNPDILTGSYRLRGHLTGGVLEVEPTRWVQQPPGYVMVGFRAPVTAPKAKTIEGDVTSSACQTFTFRR